MNIKQFAKKIEERLAESFAKATEISHSHAYRRDFVLTQEETRAYIEESKSNDMDPAATTTARLVIQLFVENLPYRQPKIEDVKLEWRVGVMSDGQKGAFTHLSPVKGFIHFKQDGEVGFSVTTDSLVDQRPKREVLWTGLDIFKAPASKVVDTLIENMPYMTSRHRGMSLQAEYLHHQQQVERIMWFGAPAIQIASALNAKR